jgi:outer membrane cobalamin receptor
MFRTPVIIAAAIAAFAAPAFAQDDPAAQEVEGVVIASPRLDERPREEIAPVTTVDSEDLELTSSLTVDDAFAPATWTSDRDVTSSRVGGRGSSARVIRACEISLTLDGDCAGK